MRVICISNSGKSLNEYPRKPLGTSEQTIYGALEVGEEYLVMGMIFTEGYLGYLVDSVGVIHVYHSQLFEVVENTIPNNWFFKSFKKSEDKFSIMEAVWGYKELCFSDDHYEKLVDMDEKAHRLYFRRKIELENLYRDE